MKMPAISRIGQYAAWLLGAALFFAHTAAQACPGCKQNTTPGADGNVPPLNGASIGFGLSIFFLIFMIVALLSGLGFMMYRSCRALAARDRELLQTEEAAYSGSANALQLRPA